MARSDSQRVKLRYIQYLKLSHPVTHTYRRQDLKCMPVDIGKGRHKILSAERLIPMPSILWCFQEPFRY